MRKLLAAEFLGTFGIVFAPVALSATGGLHGGDGSLLAASLVSGAAVAIMIVVFGSISGAHFNPAVTLGFAAGGKFERKWIAPYMVAQFAGGLMAAATVALLFGGGHGVHIPTNPSAVARNIGLEVLLSLLLMLTILGSIRQKHPLAPPLAIGMVVIVDVLIGGPVTGGSMNPARSLGPAMFGSYEALHNVWLYLLAPPAGAVFAALVFRQFGD